MTMRTTRIKIKNDEHDDDEDELVRWMHWLDVGLKMAKA